MTTPNCYEYLELGFPIVLIDPPMVEVRGERIPDVNLRDLQRVVFQQLITKPARLTGAEVRFIRKYKRLRQSELAEVLNKAGHSIVSQWEAREDEPTGMDYNTEVLLRLWMASQAGLSARLPDLIERDLKHLSQESREPLHVALSAA